MNLEHYRTALDNLRFSDEQKTRMTDRLMLAQETHTVRRPFTRLRRVPVLVMLLIALLLATAGGVAVKMVSDWFAPHYGGQHSEIINELGTLVGAYDSEDGITISVDAIVGDRHRVKLACTISRDNGEVLTEEMFLDEYGTPDYSFDVETDLDDMSNRKSSSGSRQILFEDVDRNDNCLQMYLLSDTSRKITGREGCLYIRTENLKLDEKNRTTIAEWLIEFDFDFVDHTVVLTDASEIPTEMGPVTLDLLEVSPFGIYFEGHLVEKVHIHDVRDKLREIDPDGERFHGDRSSLFIPTEVFLNRRDGTSEQVKWSARGNGAADNHITYFQAQWDFAELTAIDDIESISINGVDFAVN